jgi:hypothetical protein
MMSHHSNILVSVNAEDFVRWSAITTNLNIVSEEHYGGVSCRLLADDSSLPEEITMWHHEYREMRPISGIPALGYLFRKGFTWGHVGDVMVLMDEAQLVRWESNKSVDEILALDRAG